MLSAYNMMLSDSMLSDNIMIRADKIMLSDNILSDNMLSDNIFFFLETLFKLIIRLGAAMQNFVYCI
jgi:hypothetical protein